MYRRYLFSCRGARRGWGGPGGGGGGRLRDGPGVVQPVHKHNEVPYSPSDLGPLKMQISDLLHSAFNFTRIRSTGQCYESGSQLNPYSGPLWTRIRIPNTDPNSYIYIGKIRGKSCETEDEFTIQRINWLTKVFWVTLFYYSLKKYRYRYFLFIIVFL